MRKGLTFLFAILISLTSFGQVIQGQSTEDHSSVIRLRSIDKAECVQNDFKSLNATFSFSAIESQDIATERGEFSALSMNNTVMGGNEGDPMIPVVNELIAVPFGATPIVTIKNFSTTDYKLDELNIKKLFPRQPSLRKDMSQEEVEFVYNENAYQTRGLRSMPSTNVSVEGTMRGIRIGKLGIEPVSYDPVSNTLRVFNDIEVEVTFDGADAVATEEMLVKTFSPYFLGLYKQMFNGRAIMDAYSDHPDLYTTPPRMMVITTSTYSQNETFQEWINWKKQKGIYVDVYLTSETGTTSSSIKTFVKNKYNTGVSNGQAPTFLVIVGDVADVTYSASSSVTRKYTDLYYASVDNDVYADIFESRMPVSSTTELTNLLTKILMYEQYTMPDPSYLNNVVLVAGWDATWTPRVGKPTIQYASNYYYNTAHGFTNPHIYLTTGSGQNSECYTWLNSGVGFINYTAHGDNTMWYDPQITVSTANNLTNSGKYFWAMGNCCLAANWGYNGTCFAEALLRGQNKGAFGYIGSCPETYWYEDYYFGVGATATMNQMPTQAQTKDGVYDAIWDDDAFNTLNAVPYFGNVAVTYSHANNYSSSVSDQYYWEAYHCLGDGSVMPYHVNPSANNVTHADVLPLGESTFTVNALAGSYVSITKNNEIIGVAVVPSTGTVNVPITPVNTPCDIKIVVTRQQRQPYVATIQALSANQYTIHTTANPTAGGTVTGSGDYYENSTATVTATPNITYAFKNWKENNQVVSNDAIYSFTVTRDRNLVAQFETIPQNNISYANCEHGTVSGPAKKYPTETVTLTATAEEGYGFSSWNVYPTGHPESPITVTDNQFEMPYSDVTVSANFGQLYAITLAKNSNGNISLDRGDGNALSGDTISLTATPDINYQHSRWTVYKTDDISTIIPVVDNQFVMPAYPVTVAASFILYDTEERTIGDGSSTSVYLPTYTYYRYTLTQEIYTPAELGNATTINSISYYYNGSTTSRELDIYICHTNLSSFSGTSASNWQVVNETDRVFHGTISFSQTSWTTITFDTPFHYDGTHNLLITVDDNTGSYVTGSQAFRANTTTDYTSIYYYDDSNNLDPTNTLSTGAKYRAKANSFIKIGTMEEGNCAISVSPGTLSGFNYEEGYGPSESQSFGVISIHLNSSLTISTPNDFEICTTQNGNYSNSISLTPNNGEVTAMLFVRMKAGLSGGNYDDETLTFSGNGTTQTINLNGFVENTLPVPVTQNYTLVTGWSWWSSYIELEGTDALQALVEGLGTNASTIKSQDAFLTYDDELGWLGSLESLENEKMYKIDINGSCSVSLNDYKAKPEEHPITLNTGWNWIGYIEDQPLPLSTALANVNVTENDLIKGYDGFSTYYDGFGWWGTLTNMEPGKGYMYRSYNSANVTFTYPSITRNIEVMTDNDELHHWAVIKGRYADNLSIIATLEGGHEGDEIGAFVDGECRGSAILHYFEPTGQNIALLTLYGNDNDLITLKVLDKNEIIDLNETVTFAKDLVIGSLNKPMNLTVKGQSNLILFPNPVMTGQELSIVIPSNDVKQGTLEIIDVLGNIVRHETIISNKLIINNLTIKGVYTVRIISENGDIYNGKIVIR